MIYTNITKSTFGNIAGVALITLILLLIPLVAMQFTGEVNWTLADFIFAGVFIFSTGLIYIFGVRKLRTVRSKYIFGAALVSAFILIWSELAVGIFD